MVENPGCANGNCGYVSLMNWQQVVSLAIVALAAGLLLWGRVRPRKFSFQRDTHCGCSAADASAWRLRFAACSSAVIAFW